MLSDCGGERCTHVYAICICACARCDQLSSESNHRVRVCCVCGGIVRRRLQFDCTMRLACRRVWVQHKRILTFSSGGSQFSDCASAEVMRKSNRCCALCVCILNFTLNCILYPHTNPIARHQQQHCTATRYYIMVNHRYAVRGAAFRRTFFVRLCACESKPHSPHTHNNGPAAHANSGMRAHQF